jgi:hypothetical protein
MLIVAPNDTIVAPPTLLPSMASLAVSQLCMVFSAWRGRCVDRKLDSGLYPVPLVKSLFLPPVCPKAH